VLQGTVKWFDNDKGIGFITRDDGGDVYVTRGAILLQPAELRTGQRVQFDVLEGRNGSVASAVAEIGYTPPSRDEVKPPGALQGTVKWYDTDKRFGIIMMDGGGEASVGYGNIVTQPAELRTGQRVRFDKEDGRNGTWALNVSVTSSGPVTPTVTVGPATGLSGVVKSFDAAKGIGSIMRVDGGGDVTVESSAILAQPPVLTPGQPVRFDLTAQQSAINVRAIADEKNWMAVPLTGQGHGDHFYTTSSAERDSAVSVNSYRTEGVACYVFGNRQTGTTPLYRLFDSASGDHFYTTSSAERDGAASVHRYAPQGIACYAFDGQQAATTPLYRLFNDTSRDHFYTTSSAERDSAVSVHGYRSEGVACHVLQTQQAGSTAFYRLFHT
jgi:cold shock CspA family protein